MDLIYLIVLPFAGSVVAALLPTNARTLAATWAALVAGAAALWVALLLPSLQAGSVLVAQHRWMPSAGINFMVRMDGFAWMFAMLVTGIGALVALYARYYMSRDDPVPRFFSFFLAFMGAMLGVVLSGNVVQIAFFWELTSLFSFLLIGYWHHRRDARRGARMALTVTAMGGLALLAGVLMLGHIAGSYELDAILRSGERIRAHALYAPMLVLIVLGALTKSAQFPFQFWLPRAMAAPTPVSAYLHSATMVKAGVFLLARLWPALSGSELWMYLVGGAGLVTLVLGAYVALFQTDLKGLLAYSTISHLGLIALLLGLNRELAAVAAVFHIINHATFKASLFMAVGIIDHETGTRDIRRLSGLGRAMPITGALTFVASAAMAGVPLANGFLSKEMFFSEALALGGAPWLAWGVPAAALLAGVLAVAYSLRFSVDVFLGKPAQDLPLKPHEPVHWMRVPIEVLALLCVVVGVLPQWSIGPVLQLAARPVVGGTLPHYSLALWHGWNVPLMMSLAAMAGGGLLFAALHRKLESGGTLRVPLLHVFSGQRLFQSVLYALDRVCRALVRWLSARRLQPQMLLLVLAAMLAAGAALRYSGVSWGERERVPASLEFALLWLMGGICALAAAQQARFHRMAALMLLSGVGLAVSLTFVWFSAPDLALTQLTVEVVTTMLFLLGLRWLPRRVYAPGLRVRTPMRDRVRMVRDLFIAAAAGAGMAALAYAMMTRAAPQSISPFFIENALPGGGGANVVNVMLVDFRAFDTFGEITVLGIVALTVYALLRRFRPPREVLQLPPQQLAAPPDLVTDLINPRTSPDPAAAGYMMAPAVLARLVLPFAGLISLYFFLRGHNQPGGGFVGALVLTIGFLVQYMVAGAHWVEARLPLQVVRWIAVGWLLALATGAGAWLFGYPFLTTHMLHFELPLIGAVHLPSATFLDAGVYSVVVGATLLILAALAHQSVRGHRQSARTAADTAPAASAPAKGSTTVESA